MNSVLAAKPELITMDLTSLEFLNSSGINLLAKFTIEIRKQPEVGVRFWAPSPFPGSRNHSATCSVCTRRLN